MSDGQHTLRGQTNEGLGAFLRDRRARLAPEAKGSRTARRRTSGLRREEVARLAGISTEWLTKLEQGRGASPSLATLDGLARALRLDEAERRHLMTMAGRQDAAAPYSPPMPDLLRTLVESLAQPAYITDRRWEVLAWNAAAQDLLNIDFAAMATGDRNILTWMLVNPGARTLFGATWEDEARRMTSLFRTSYDLHADDPKLRRQVAMLNGASPEFGVWWQGHDIGAPRSGVKHLHHPRRGKLTVLFSTFQANDDPALKLALYIETTH